MKLDHRPIATVLVLLAPFLVVSCVGGSDEFVEPTTFQQTPFRASNFVDPRAGSNPWLPLKPGTQWVREGTTLIGNREVPQQIVTTLTDVIRVIEGVKAVLTYEVSTGAGQVVQRTVDYFAQDKEGNIWLMGSVTEQYEAGRFVDVDEAWLAGVDGAKPGILMPANPTTGITAWVIARPPEEDGDAAQVVRMQRQQCVPFDCFQNVLVVREGKRTALDNEFKYYAFGVGQIRNEPQSESRHEDIEWLINITTITPKGLAEASAKALEIDRTAAEDAPEVFGSVRATRAP